MSAQPDFNEALRRQREAFSDRYQTGSVQALSEAELYAATVDRPEPDDAISDYADIRG